MWHNLVEWGMVWVGSGWLAIALYAEFEPEGTLRKEPLGKIFLRAGLMAPLVVLALAILTIELALAHWANRKG